MCNVLRITATTAAIGVAALSLTAPAHAGQWLCGWSGAHGIWRRRYFRKRSHTANGVCRSTPTAASLLRATAAAGLLRDGGLWTSLRLLPGTVIVSPLRWPRS